MLSIHSSRQAHRLILATALLTAAAEQPAAAGFVEADLDASSIEFNDKVQLRLEAARAANLSLRVCQDHFPPGSQAAANIQAAADLFNSILNVGVEITLSFQPHLSPTQAWASPPASDMAMGYVNTCLDGTYINASGSVGYYNGATATWKCWGIDASQGVNSAQYFHPARSTLITINADTYPQHFTDPWEVDRAPSTAVFFHELGHAFGMGHDDESAYPSALRATSAMNDVRWLWQDSGIPDPSVSAYTKAHMRHFYPAATITPEALHEYYNHEILILDDGTTKYYQDLNPRNLRYDPVSGTFYDCNTGSAPVYRVNWSDRSDRMCDAAQVLTQIQIKDDMGFFNNLASQGHDAENCQTAFANYRWSKTLTIRGTLVGIPSPTGSISRTLRTVIDGAGQLNERNENNNTLDLQLTLWGATAVDAACPQ